MSIIEDVSKVILLRVTNSIQRQSQIKTQCVSTKKKCGNIRMKFCKILHVLETHLQGDYILQPNIDPQ